MRFRFSLIAAVVAMGGCDLTIPNGLFGCGQPSDCPTGHFCWSSDSRCYDTKEPECVPKTCDEVISDFASLGISIECGALPDGCDGSIECGSCPAGTVCGANGENFACGCEENTCASYGGGAECGVIPTRCGVQEEAIFCGDCLGEGFACVQNECVCPPGVDCGGGCGGSCRDGEVCVGGECCEPSYPCVQNECSPPGGLANGCGGFTQCPQCGNGEDCVLSDNLRYQCLGECTCEAQGWECGSTSICGSPTLCGTCADNGFEPGYHCESGRCVCEDSFEYNDSFETFSLICDESLGINCMQPAWSVEIQATLHDFKDVDYYALRVLDARTPVIAQAYNGASVRVLSLAYLCPDGFDGIEKCSGSKQKIDGIEFCVADGDWVGIERRCDGILGSQVGTVLVGVRSREFESDCDPYGLKVLATYGAEIPTF